MFFATDIPGTESDANAHKLCSNEAGAQKHCPKRWAAMQKWFTLAREVFFTLHHPALDSNDLGLSYHSGFSGLVYLIPNSFRSDVRC